MLGADPCSIFLGGAAPPGSDSSGREHPCPTRPGRRRLGVSLARQGQPTSASETGNTTQDSPGPQVASPGAAVPTLATTGGTGSTRPWGPRGHGPCADRLHGAMAQPVPVTPEGETTGGDGTHNAEGCRRASAKTQPRGGVPLGGVMRPTGHPRPSMEAGTRRKQGRW